MREAGFNPVLLGSKNYVIQQMCNKPVLISTVRDVLKLVGKKVSTCRKRLSGVTKAYLTQSEFEEIVGKANMEKMAHMVKILAFLMQKKVYLIWHTDIEKKE